MAVKPELDPSRLAAWQALLRAHATVVEAVEDALAAAALPALSWYDVLWPLYSEPERRLRMRDLAERVVISRTGLVRLVDRIEAAGLLRREPVPGDRRGAYAAITPEGIAMLKRMWPVYGRVLAACFAERLTDAEAATLAKALDRVAESRTGDQR
jgi:DNA-binding MarR family transcriptional regulator